MNKYFVLSLFIFPSALSNPPPEGKNLFKGQKLCVQRKRAVKRSAGTLFGINPAKAIKKTPRTTTALDFRLHQSRGPSQQQDILALVKALPPPLEDFSFYTHSEDLSFSAPSLRALSRLSHLRKLNIYKSSPKGSLFQDREALRELEHLKLKTVKLRSSLAQSSFIDRPLKLHKNLENLICEDTGFTNLKVLERTLAPLPFLTSLTLSNIGKFSMRGSKPWALDNKSIFSLSRIMKRLKRLEIIQSLNLPLSGEGITHLLGPKMESLSLRNFENGFNLGLVADYLRKDRSSLKRLSLAANVFTFPSPDREKGDIQVLFSKLDSLSLRLTRWRNESEKNLLAFFSDLSFKGVSIKNLHLASNGSMRAKREDYDGLLAILRLPTLQHLSLDSECSHAFYAFGLQDTHPEKSFFNSFELICAPRKPLHAFLNTIFKRAPIETFSIAPSTEFLQYSETKGGYSTAKCILENPHLKTLKLGAGKITAQDLIKLFSKKGLEKIYLKNIDVIDINPDASSNNFFSSLQRAIFENPTLTSIHCCGGGQTFDFPAARRALLQAEGQRAFYKGLHSRTPSLYVDFDY